MKLRTTIKNIKLRKRKKNENRLRFILAIIKHLTILSIYLNQYCYALNPKPMVNGIFNPLTRHE